MDSEWIDNMRSIMVQAVEAGKPCDLLQGTVLTASPLSVKIDQKTTVAGVQLLLPHYLTDHPEQMNIPGIGEVEVVIRNALKPGEAVLLLQKRGAQQYLVIDRY